MKPQSAEALQYKFHALRLRGIIIDKARHHSY